MYGSSTDTASVTRRDGRARRRPSGRSTSSLSTTLPRPRSAAAAAICWLARGAMGPGGGSPLVKLGQWANDGPASLEEVGELQLLARGARRVAADEVWATGFNSLVDNPGRVVRASLVTDDGESEPAWQLEEHDSRSTKLLYGIWADDDVVWLAGEGGTLRRMTRSAVKTKTFETVDSPVHADLYGDLRLRSERHLGRGRGEHGPSLGRRDLVEGRDSVRRRDREAASALGLGQLARRRLDRRSRDDVALHGERTMTLAIARRAAFLGALAGLTPAAFVACSNGTDGAEPGASADASLDSSALDSSAPDQYADVTVPVDDAGSCSEGGFCREPLPVHQPLVAVTAASADDVWAVGGNVIVRWNGTSWNTVYQYGGTSEFELVGVWGTKSDDIWALAVADAKAFLVRHASADGGPAAFREILPRRS